MSTRKKKRPAASKKAREAKSEANVSREWRTWIAQNLMLGAEEGAILDRLTAEGVSERRARAAIAAIRRSPAFEAGRELGRSSRRLLMILGLQRDLRGTTRVVEKIERRRKPPAAEFFERYFATSTPVVLTDAQRGWKARRRWNARYFERRLGDVDIEVTSGRDADPDYDMNTPAHAQIVKMRDFSQRVMSAKTTNDFYMVANNKAMERDGMDVLLDDVIMDPTYFDTSRVQGGVSLWFGPKGTVTPLHHDTTSIVFHQIWGKKRFHLISPFETALLGKARGFYCDLDPDRKEPELADVPISKVDLDAGESLFLPVGWWHKVRSLSPSISISFTNLRPPNNYDWYRPGHVR